MNKNKNVPVSISNIVNITRYNLLTQMFLESTIILTSIKGSEIIKFENHW